MSLSTVEMTSLISQNIKRALPLQQSKKTTVVADSYILFCLLCYRLSVYTDSAVFNSKLCIILIWFMDC